MDVEKLDVSDIPRYREHLIKSFSCIKGNQIIRANCSTISNLSAKISDTLKDFKDPKKWKLTIITMLLFLVIY